MQKKTIDMVTLFVLLVGVTIGTIVATAAAWDAPHSYQINENGQTYGGMNPYSTDPQDEPDLIAAIGIDGTEGYVYRVDLDGNQPSNPEEAIEYMEEMEKAYAEAREAGEEFSRYIPLYASDGTTVIGEFGISFPNMD